MHSTMQSKMDQAHEIANVGWILPHNQILHFFLCYSIRIGVAPNCVPLQLQQQFLIESQLNL